MEQLKHECGVAMIRLLKPLSYYEQKYGTSRYGLNKLYLMMEKQHNRGQEGAGIACVNMGAPVGEEYMFRERAEGKDAITEIFRGLSQTSPRRGTDASETSPAGGGWEGASLYMGHLRYSTTGKRGLTYVHPFFHKGSLHEFTVTLISHSNLWDIDWTVRSSGCMLKPEDKDWKERTLHAI